MDVAYDIWNMPALHMAYSKVQSKFHLPSSCNNRDLRLQTHEKS